MKSCIHAHRQSYIHTHRQYTLCLQRIVMHAVIHTCRHHNIYIYIYIYIYTYIHTYIQRIMHAVTVITNIHTAHNIYITLTQQPAPYQVHNTQYIHTQDLRDYHNIRFSAGPYSIPDTNREIRSRSLQAT
jgi:hypothetical protein